MQCKPLIGVTPQSREGKHSQWIQREYLDAVAAAGGLPVLLPLGMGESVLRALYARCDGLLVTGGHDVDPALYGEEKLPLCGALSRERDDMELHLLRWAVAEDKPVLGVCRGAQMLNVALGGGLYQDLPAQLEEALEHAMEPPYDRPCHEVRLTENGLLRALTGRERLMVNSLHHQGIRRVGEGLRVEAAAADGLTEAVSLPGRRFVLGVQWHPEYLYAADESARVLFEALVRGSIPAGSV